MIKVVFFDLGDTLIHAPTPAPTVRGHSLATFLRQEGLPITDQDVTDVLASLRGNEAPDAGNCYGQWFQLERTRIAACCEAAGHPMAESILDAMTLRFRRHLASRTALFDDAIPTLRRLREAGLGVSIISNNDGRTVMHIERHGLTPWVDHVIDSAAVGCTKPDARIYAYALARAGVTASEAAMVGDSARYDATGAVEAGLHGYWLNRRANKQHDDARVTTITALSELPDHLIPARAGAAV